MKKFKYIFIVTFISAINLISAQRIGNLDGIYYQAVALNDKTQEIVGIDIEANPLYNKEIGVRFTIAKGLDGEVQWEETHITTTDAHGLFSLVIGKGEVTSTSYVRLLDIPWIDADQFLKVEISTNNDGNYTMVSNQKFMAVPYAFYADDIADDAITTEKILNEEILAEDIHEGAVETSEILNGTILNEDIADNTINLSTKVTDILSVEHGGTGLNASTVTDGQILIGDGTTNDFKLSTITAGDGVVIDNTPGTITISSPPVSTSADGSFTIPVGSNGTISGNSPWYSPNSLKVDPPVGKPFEMGDIFLASANVDLKGCILSVYLQSIDGNGQANVQVILYNPQNNSVTLQTPVTFKFLLVK
ncbi:hypothetical protein [Thalassobellus suaedae]|uniref:Uncharacterized protein n=1 Tax=Thalassobellus suaedae TaxID=3074124 RepID=A0ABY9Y5X6_9FLAO|nr:hypothetical protein RHP49_05070 [Flavobacteriaceae bacterium HL-DH10]